MKIDVEKKERGTIEVTVELSAEEYQPFLKKAANAISQQTKIEGFRPGHASYDMIKNRVGEGEIWKQAIEPAVQKTLIEALDQEKLMTVGSPHIDVVKLAPGNPVIYKATLSLLPNVKLADYKNLSVERKSAEVQAGKIDKVISDLQKRRAKETAVNREAQKGDKVEIDFDVFLDNVPIENGAQKKFPLQIGENTFIPGFEDQLLGMKKGEEKKFTLSFPKEYYAKNLAGKEAEFKVIMNAVFAIELPEPNDDFAKGFGLKSFDELKKQLSENLKKEAEQKAQQELEEKIMETLIEKSSFDDIPDLLIDSETKKMIQELEHNISHQGLQFEDYLTHLKKSRTDLMMDFVPQAMKRVKSALITRAVGQEIKADATDVEVETEIQNMLAMHGGNPEMETQLTTPEYKGYIRNVIAARKVMDHLIKSMVK